jgi:hypothetical protein
MRLWLDQHLFAGRIHQSQTFEEMVMKTLYALTLAALVGIAAPAFADDATAVKGRSGKIQTAAVNVDAGGAPKVSQQEKMRQCAKQATGKKGAERKAFMKGCLSKKKG